MNDQEWIYHLIAIGGRFTERVERQNYDPSVAGSEWPMRRFIGKATFPDGRTFTSDKLVSEELLNGEGIEMIPMIWKDLHAGISRAIRQWDAGEAP